jgi:hypothetical protein
VEGDVSEIPYVAYTDTSSAGTPDPARGGAVPCTCSFVALQEEGSSCAVELYTCATEAIAAIEEGDPCASQEDCMGSGGTCGTTRCFCDTTRNSCKFKFDIGTPCQAEYQCNSGVCSDRGGLPEKRCVAATPEEETTPPPQPTESELFPTYYLRSPIGGATGPELIGRIIKTVLTLAGALALAMFIYGGFTWLTSGGSPDKIKKGKDILMWATIGLIVVFSSYTLVDFLLKSFGL